MTTRTLQIAHLWLAVIVLVVVGMILLSFASNAIGLLDSIVQTLTSL